MPQAVAGVSASIVNAAPEPNPEPSSAGLDDCFCCSHVVDVASIKPGVRPLETSRAVPEDLLIAPRVFGQSLFHPPLV